ncbi:MAG: Rpn family recombination-promoting nuclease/putative transposase [Gemmatimonadetes bacterium]|nr:Rpn family recombination-promoting nuclease/putative transposase [Gemmatimonadota bacterium]
MKDPILKRLFGHAEVVEILIRDVLPEDARRIDLSTLEKLGTEFVGEALVRRYPDMMWTAHTRDGTGRVVILVEFQGRPDRLMPLRTAIYSHLAVQEMLRRSRPAPRPDSIEVLPPIVIYHGRGAWKGPTALGELFPRGIPREFRVIFRDPAGSESGTAGDPRPPTTAR